MKTLLAVLALAAACAAQQIVNDPRFQNATAWQKLNASTIVGGNGAIWMGSEDHRRILVGIWQDIEVKEAGVYQMAFSGGGGGYDGAPMQARCSPFYIDLSNYPNDDFRTQTAYLPAGTVRVSVNWDRAPVYPYWGRIYGLTITKVDLPIADWRFQSYTGLNSCYIGFTTTLRSPSTADAVLTLLSTKRLAQGVPIYGVQGLLWVDPTALVVLPMRSYGFSWWQYPWPSLYAQVMEIDFDTWQVLLGSPSPK